MAYIATISDSNRDLTARERIMLKDTTDAISLDDATQKGAVIIKPVLWAVVEVHNDASDDKDYNKYIVVSDAGDKYVTGSAAFWRSFEDIALEMGDEEYSIKVYRVPSKNYKGKDFITCSIL